MNLSVENVPMFSANYTLDPFVDYMVDELHPYYGFRERLRLMPVVIDMPKIWIPSTRYVGIRMSA